MTRDEAIGRIKARFDKWALDDEDMKAIQTLIPELHENDDERIRKEIKHHISLLEFYRFMAASKEECLAYLEKQKESLHISETCKESADSFTDDDERIRKKLIEIIGYFRSRGIDQQLCEEFIAYLEKQKECLADNNKTSTDEDERIRKEINTLYSDIDACITELLKARTDKDSESEGKALFKMEGLMVATLQDLSCIEDYLEKQKEPLGDFIDNFPYSDEQKEQKPGEDEKIKKTIRQLLETARDTHSNTSLAKPFIDALDWLEKQKETIHISENGMLAWLKKQEEEEGYEAIPVESTLEYKLGFKAGKESEKQKEQKPVSNPKWAELTWKDINELERIINNVHYEFQNGIGEDSFGELVLERFKEYKDDGSMDEQKPAECERQPEFKEVEYDFRGEKVKVMRPFFRDDKGREFSTTGQDTDLTWSVLREWCEIKGIIPYDLYPRAEWSEEDEEMLDIVLIMVDCSTVVPHSGGQLHPSESYKKDISDWLKSLRPQPKIEKIEWDSHDKAIVGCIAVCLDGQFVTEAARKQCLEWFNKHRIDFLNSTSWKPSEEYIRKDALIEWLRKEYETVSWYDEKMRHVTRCVGDTSSSGKAQAYQAIIDKINSM